MLSVPARTSHIRVELGATSISCEVVLGAARASSLTFRLPLGCSARQPTAEVTRAKPDAIWSRLLTPRWGRTRVGGIHSRHSCREKTAFGVTHKAPSVRPIAQLGLL